MLPFFDKMLFKGKLAVSSFCYIYFLQIYYTLHTRKHDWVHTRGLFKYDTLETDMSYEKDTFM